MKIRGYKPANPNIDTVVIPRGDGNDLIFRVQAVLDIEPFEKLCPLPTPPTILHKGGEVGVDIEDNTFKEKMNKWASYKSNWILLQALKATEDLEWETIDHANPETWKNWLDELKDFKMTEQEITLLIKAIHSVNGLDEEKIEAARKRFLASQVVVLSGQ